MGYQKTWFAFVNRCKVPVFVYWCDRAKGTASCRTTSFGHMIDLMVLETEWSWYDSAQFDGVVMAACPQNSPSGEDVQIETLGKVPLDAYSPYRCIYFKK